MTQQSPPYALQAGSHGAELFRRANGTLLGSAGGIVGSGDYAVTQNGTPNMSVNVAGGKPGGEIWVPGTSSSAQGLYYAFNDATVNLAIAASNPSNPRIDVAAVQIQDAAYAGAVNSASLVVVTGTPAGSPVAPSAPASSLVLANVAVAALATTVVTGNITDRRVQATTALLGTKVANTQLDQTTVTPQLGLSDGTSIRRGKSNIATTESRSNAAYGLLTTPDRVQNVVLPTDGLIFVAYQATWQESVSNAGRAAIFIGANQLKSELNGAAAPGAATEAFIADVVNQDQAMGTSGVANGLRTFGKNGGGSSAYSGDVTTGQVIGDAGGGGAVAIFAAAGTYDVSIQFKASSGSVTAKNRKLWVWTIGF